MPLPYPDELLQEREMSIQEFNAIAKELLLGGEDAVKAFVQFTLAGRHTNDEGVVERITLAPERGLPDPRDHQDIAIHRRDFDSLIGITTDWPFTVPVSIYPVPPFEFTFKKDNHLKRRIHRPVCTIKLACTVFIK